MKYAHLVLRNLWRNRRRTILTALSIAVSLFVFATLMTLPGIARQMLRQAAAAPRLVTHNKAGFTSYKLPESYRRQIVAIPHVDAVIGVDFSAGIYRTPWERVGIFAVDPDQFEQIWPEWKISREAIDEFRRTRTACLVTKTVMRRFGWRLGQQVVVHGAIYPVDLTFTIAGLIGDKAPPNLMMARRDYLDELTGRTGLVSNFWVRVDQPESIPLVIAAIDARFANSAYESETEAEDAFFASFLSGVGPIFAMAQVLGVIVVITIGLVAANTAAMAIRERRFEIAVLRAIGFSARAILAQFVAECLIMGIAGWVLGCLGAWLFFRFVPVGLPTLATFMRMMPPSVLMQSLAVAVAIGLLSGLIPAGAALRGNIVEGMRHAG